LLPIVLRAGDIERQLRARDAGAVLHLRRRSAANAGRVTVTSDGGD